MEYMIIVRRPDVPGEQIVHSPTAAGWTHDTATHWARVESNLPADSTIRIQRRRGAGLFQPHRLYTVGEDGIVRRTDR